MNRGLYFQKGFTILEIFIAITILLVLGSTVFAVFAVFQERTEISAASQELATVLKLAQSKTLASQNNTTYGVYLNTAVTPNQYVLFQGSTYATRVPSSDLAYPLSKTVEFSDISLGGGSEVNFQKLTGSSTAGNFSVRLKNNISQIVTIYISAAGLITFTAPVAVSDTRVKDSRHTSFNYNRSIDTATEVITLNFDNAVNKSIPVSQNLVAGQLYWSGSVTAGGAAQQVTILTTRLNNPDTEFHV